MPTYDFSENSDSVNLGSNPSPPTNEISSLATDFCQVKELEAFTFPSPKAPKTKSPTHKSGHSKVTVRSRGRGLSKAQKRRVLCDFGFVYGIG